MQIQSVDELKRNIKSDKRFFFPFAIWGNPETEAGGFSSLQDARFWFIRYKDQVLGEIDNSGEFYLHAELGWFIVSIEINCISGLKFFKDYGIDEILDEGHVAERISGSYMQKLLEILQEAFDEPATRIYNNAETCCDFYSLEHCVSYAQTQGFWSRYTYFCETPEGRWLILVTISSYHMDIARSTLGNHCLKTLDIREAYSFLSSEG